jgi:hypothetical protein
MRTKTCYYGCENNHLYHQDNPHAFPYKQFGKDVYALVAFLRYKKHSTLEEIQATIEQTYQFRLDEETIRSMIQFYHLLVHEFISPENCAQMRANQGVILAIDALEPTKGADPLYTVRDVLTETVLAAQFIYSASESVLTEFFSHIKIRLAQLAIPILGIISDKHRGQEKALEQVFPQVPHQLCIYHFFKAAAAPAIQWDRHLTTQLRSILRKNHYIRELKKSM